MLRTLQSLISLSVCGLFIQGCSPVQKVSDTEQRVLQSAALSQRFNVHDRVGDVNSLQDAIPASRPFHVDQISSAIEVPVRDCTVPGLYEMEKQMALNEASADPTGQTVPVKFSYSFGRKHDYLAKWANRRAILSASNGGVSYIPVGGKKSNSYNGNYAYYEADNSEVARQYKTGEKCFFSTIKVDPANFHTGKGKFDFIDISDEEVEKSRDLFNKPKTAKASMAHMIHYMYYGFCQVGRCAPDQAFAGEFANRLFKEVPSMDGDEPQIIKLYVADLRSEQMKHDIVVLSEDTVRGKEIDSSIDNILNICAVHENYFDVTKNLSLPATINDFEFDPINGAVQLVNNILSHDVDGTMLSSQYTPIVIDLDGDGVKTSSVRWGTFFNMAALENTADQGQKHRTAWLGGDYVDQNLVEQDSRVQMDVRLQTSGDGFLVIPDDNGQVTSSTQMFGDNMVVGGKSYANGFLALQAFAGKDCSSSDIKDRYVGSWDGDIYENQLKIWVDKNRNGRTDDGELVGLRDAKVAAINACHIVHQDEKDNYGNGTQLRSAVLMAGPYPYLLDNPEEVVYFLEYGQGYDGEKAYFNLAIDLIFQVKTEHACPGPLLAANDYPALATPSSDSTDEMDEDDDDQGEDQTDSQSSDDGNVGIPTVTPTPINPDNF